MRKIILILAIFLGLSASLFAQNKISENIDYGVLFMAGGRYDNYRMCVASDAGVKGGTMADIMFVASYYSETNISLGINIPVMRPLLFGLAFKMLQFEPEMTFFYYTYINDKIDFVSGTGLGLSFHYGPDYNSDLDNRGNSFFAMGPLFSVKAGLAFKKNDKEKNQIALKAFYIPLFAKDRTSGTVAGGALVYTYNF